jgi:hypothetical protein
MAPGQTRIDVVRRQPQQHAAASSSYCSATSVAVFVGLCLVGVWMVSSTLVSPAEFTPFQAFPLPRRPTPAGETEPDAAPAGGNATTVVREDSADEQEVPPAARQDAVAEPTERTNQPPEEQIVTDPEVEKPDGEQTNPDEQNVTDPKVEKPDGDQEQTNPDEQNVTDPKAEPDDQEQESKKDAEVFPDASQAELLNQTATDQAPWHTQAAKSDTDTKDKEQTTTAVSDVLTTNNWKLCDTEAGADYIPCLDNMEAIRKLKHDEHYEHRERHCPEEPPVCLVPLPKGYRSPIRWPKSRDQVQKFSVVVDT